MPDSIRVLSLCSGTAGLDLGFGEVFNSRTVAYVEREGYAVANLAARIREGRLDAAPIFPDVQRFNAKQFLGSVDAVIAGFPCPPVSVAGARQGIEDERWLWPDVWRVVRETGATILGLENVAGLVSAGDAFGSILADLAESGWSAEWLTLRASDVGASHRRERWFLLAYRNSGDDDGSGQSRTGRGAESPDGGGAVADADSGRQQRLRRSGLPGNSETECGGDADGRYGMLPRFAPGPSSPDWPAILADYPELIPAYEAQPEFRGVADGLANRLDRNRMQRLRLCGNGVVPEQAAAAFRELYRRLNS